MTRTHFDRAVVLTSESVFKQKGRKLQNVQRQVTKLEYKTVGGWSWQTTMSDRG